MNQEPGAVSGRATAADAAAVLAIANSWAGMGPVDASWIADQWIQQSLSASDITQIQGTYPDGIGFYVAWLLGWAASNPQAE